MAALGVLAYHVGKLTDRHGWLHASTSRFWVGVPLFFVISGFLLYRPFAHATIHRTQRPSLRRFGRARVLRILPAYWVVLTVTILTHSVALISVVIAAAAACLWVRSWLTGSRPIAAVLVSVLAIGALVLVTGDVAWAGFSNYFLLFLPFGPYGLVGPAWTLCVEAGFYLFMPVIAVAGLALARGARTPQGRATRLALLLAGALPAGPIYLCYAGEGRQLPLWLPGYIDQFAIGMLLAVAVETWPSVSVRMSRLLLFVAFGVAAVANGLYQLGPRSFYGNGSGVVFAPLIAIAFATAFASVLLRNESTVLGRLLGSRGLVALGTISYGVYLWHFLLIEEFRKTGLWSGETTNLLLIFVSTVVLATASWLLIEAPAIRLKNRELPALRVSRGRPEPPPVAGLAPSSP